MKDNKQLAPDAESSTRTEEGVKALVLESAQPRFEALILSTCLIWGTHSNSQKAFKPQFPQL